MPQAVPRTLALACTAAVVGVGVAVVVRPVLAAFVLALLLSAGLLAVLTRALTPDAETRKRIVAWTFAAFVIHVIFGLIVINTSLVYHLGPDALFYDQFAREMVRHWNSGFPRPDLVAGKEGFPMMLAGLYWLLFPSAAVGIVMNSCLAAGIVPVVCDATNRAFGRRAARFVPALIVLFPAFFIWTSHLLKEGPILFFLAIVLNCAIRITRRFSAGALLVMSLSLAILLSFRAWIALAVGAALVASILWSRREVFVSLGTSLATIIMMAILVMVGGLGYQGYQAAVGADLEDASTLRQNLALTADSGFEHEVDISTPSAALVYLPKGLISIGLGPFPWQLGGARQAIGLVDVVAWWALLPALWRGQRLARRMIGRQAVVLILPAIATAVMLSLAIGNFGTALRERPQFQIFLVPLIALGLAESTKRRATAGDETDPTSGDSIELHGRQAAGGLMPGAMVAPRTRSGADMRAAPGP